MLTFMMVMYALERRGKRFVLAFALGCALSSSYGFASGACSWTSSNWKSWLAIGVRY